MSENVDLYRSGQGDDEWSVWETPNGHVEARFIKSSYPVPTAKLGRELARLAARVAELEEKSAKLRACVEAYIVPVAALVLDAGNRKLFAPEVWDALVAADVAARAEVENG